MVAVADERRADRKSLKVEVSPEFRRRIKIRAAEEELTLRQYVLEALERDLDAGNGARGKEKQAR